MVSKGLSSFGAFAYTFNSFTAFTLFLIPSEMNLIWLLSLFFSGIISLLASRFIIGLSDLLQQERHGSGPTATLLPVSESQRDSEISIPSLVQEATKRDCCGRVMYLVVVYCCILGLVAVCLIDADSMEQISEDNCWMYVRVCTVLVIVTVMNMFELEQLELVHIAMAICRVVYCTYRPLYKLEKNEFNENTLLPSSCIAAFFYQLALPGILATYKRPLQTHMRMQTLAVGASFLAYIFLATVLWDQSESYPSTAFGAGFISLYMVSKLASMQICWKTLARIVIAWRYGAIITVAREKYPMRIRLIEMFVHWPVYAAYLVGLELQTVRVTYLKNFFVWVPFLTLAIYASVVHSYEMQLKFYSDAEVRSYRYQEGPKWAIAAFKWTLAILSFGGLGYLVWEMERSGGDEQFNTFFLGLGVLGAMLLWNFVGSCSSSRNRS